MQRVFHYFLFLAEPFGFGPISSSIAVARQLKREAPEKRCLFVGSGTSHQLASKSAVFDEVLWDEKLTPETLNAFVSGINPSNCLIIANTFPDAVNVAAAANFTCVFIDTLFWMWKQLPVSLSKISRYFIEDFHCVDMPTDRFGYSDKFSKVAPLINLDVSARTFTKPLLLISLGGIDSNLYDFPIFYEDFISDIAQNESLSKFTILICGGGKRFREEHFQAYERDGLKITCLPPAEYISSLKAAQLVIASAGLHSFYESYFLKKNVMFLPPQSYSQYLQLKYVLENFSSVIGINFEQLGIAHCLRPNMPDEERINEVKRTNRVLVEKPVKQIFNEMFDDFVSGKIKTNWDAEQHPLQSTANGPLTIAKALLSHG